MAAPSDKSKEENEKTVVSDCFGSPSKCESLQRLTKCLDFYQHIIDGQNCDALLAYFSDDNYPRVQLLDDWNHVVLHHLGDQRTSRESLAEYERIHSHVIGFKSLKACDLDHCRAFVRNNRDRESEQHKLPKESVADESEAKLLTFYVDELDTIHCYLLHSFECGFRVRVNEILSDEEEKDEAAMTDLYNQSLQRLLAQIRVARKRFEQVRGASRMQHSKFVTEVMVFKEEEQEQKQEAKEEAQKYVNYQNESFPFEYDGGYGDIHQKAKYANLEDEAAHNNIHRISLPAFKDLVVKATESMTSDYGKSLRSKYAFGSSLKLDSPITTEHLVVVLLYCNFSRLSYEFSRTFRAIKKDENEWEAAERNREFFWWSRLLKETVNYYGTAIRDSKLKKLFHGVSDRMVFEGFVLQFSTPASLTAQESVAMNFATGNGIVLQLEEESTDLCFFNCSWLSCFGNEDERLLFGTSIGAPAIAVRNICCMRSGSDYRLYVRAFMWFHRCLTGYPRDDQQTYGGRKATRKHGRVIESMLQHFDADLPDYNNKLPDYVNALFDQFRTSRSFMRIKISHMHQLYAAFQPILCASDDCRIIKIAQICKIFNNVNYIWIYYDKKDRADFGVFWSAFLEQVVETKQHIQHKLQVTLYNVDCDDAQWQELTESAVAKQVSCERDDVDDIMITINQEKEED